MKIWYVVSSHWDGDTEHGELSSPPFASEAFALKFKESLGDDWTNEDIGAEPEVVLVDVLTEPIEYDPEDYSKYLSLSWK